MKWCSNDCHPQPMWCGRKNCLNKAEFAKKISDAQKEGTNNEKFGERKSQNNTSGKTSNEFKIALAAMCSEEDYKLLENQFFSEN